MNQRERQAFGILCFILIRFRACQISREAQILGILKSGTRVRVRAATVDNALWSTIYDVSDIPQNLRTISIH